MCCLKLRDVMPKEAIRSGEFEECRFNKFLDHEVLEEFKDYDERFPFKHKNIHVWWILEDMVAVAWNENPSRGWSFPVSRVKIKGRCGYCASFGDDIRLCDVKTERGWTGEQYKFCKNCRTSFLGLWKYVKTGGKKRGSRKER